MPSQKQKFIIIDGNALLHRAWHAIPDLTTKDGLLVNAVYGWLMIFFKMYKDLKPDYIAVTFDLAGPTFRHEKYKGYKATRVKKEDELYAQLPMLKEIIKFFNVQIYEKQGYEADDVIGTLCDNKQINTENIISVIVTGDLDTLQLVDDNTEVYTLKRGLTDTIIYTEKDVKEKYQGLTPAQMIDYKALRGDPSDNIPGVKGIGEKGAINLLLKYKTLENLYKQLEADEENLRKNNIKQRIINLLKEYKEDAFLSKSLGEIKRDLPLNFKIEDCKVRPYNRDKVVKALQQYEFKSLLNKLPEINDQKSKNVTVTKNPKQQSLLVSDKEQKPKIIQNKNYKLIDNYKDFEIFLKELKSYKGFAFDTETSSINPYEAELLGISFCGKAGFAYYVIFNKEWLKILKPILENEKQEKYGHNIKYDIAILYKYGINVSPLSFDTMIASYLLNPGSRGHSLDNTAFAELGHEMIPISDLIGSGRNQLSMSDVPVQDVSQYSCEDADFTFQLAEHFKKELEQKNILGLMEKIEMPVVSVLHEMEKNGVLLNKLKISTEGLRKTKTGISTAADELEKLKGRHKIIELISKHRELAKLKSTYIDALPLLVNSEGRIHTSFNQTVTSTGRLSSSNPNLQNIPIRTKLGNEIRKSFIAPKGFKIVSADYSQIELRVIASLAKDKDMIEGFKNNEDIHKRTASEIFKVPQKDVTKQQRYAAKAINFGIIYGQGPYGLAQSADITHEEARLFISEYFKIHSKIKKYLDEMKDMAREHGYVETLFGRRRYLPEINSGVAVIRNSAERMAINAPIQGTAADLMKIAMVEVYKKLLNNFPKVKMILQVHDELVFEVPENEVKKFSLWVKDIMNNIYTLSVPIETDVEFGDNWGNMQDV